MKDKYNLDVVIPVKERPEVVATVHSLLDIDKFGGKIVVCEGGSCSLEGKQYVHKLENLDRVTLLMREQSRFNKGKLINAGIRQSDAPFILTSDADIIWSEKTLTKMIAALKYNSDKMGMCYVARVRESSESNPAAERERYRVQVEKKDEEATVRIYRECASSKLRPGYGLVLASRVAWLKVGGYHEGFSGWGWEDVDCLIRAELLNIRVLRAGTVLHMSHGEEERNINHTTQSPAHTRNLNILTSRKKILGGFLSGELTAPHVKKLKVTFELPSELEKLRNGVCKFSGVD